ncbi:MAG TPA: hypothetical protein VF138_03145 [Caulobacteraceae bacterium]
MRGAVLPLLLLLSACATQTSYSLGDGIASYDELKRATAECQAKGGTVRPGGQGDTTRLNYYNCVIPRGS